MSADQILHALGSSLSLAAILLAITAAALAQYRYARWARLRQKAHRLFPHEESGTVDARARAARQRSRYLTRHNHPPARTLPIWDAPYLHEVIVFHVLRGTPSVLVSMAALLLVSSAIVSTIGAWMAVA